jgi:hypothetical protein
MPDGFTGQFYIQIQNADNPTLGQNGQGVCGVNLSFDHEYLGDLQITLTSPAGQTVTLVGPIGFFGETDFTTWNVSFVPCGDPANPDPGFSPTWNNNQPWGLFGNYSGSYYPAAGCLENFSSGSVNGQWTLTVIDGQAIDVGNFFNYEIIFCDPSGINCFSCAANAGNLLQPDVVACEGAASLDLNLPPTYAPPNSPPPSSDYGYTYVVSGAGGVIQGYEPDANLMGYPPGNYTVCGLSYLLANEGDIPAPNGSLTTTQLSAQLNSTTPPFCGKITANCVNVTINALPPDIEEYQTICAPQCYLFFNQSYCQSGTYVRNLTQNGCPYTATLFLTVVQPSFATINEMVCPDECSQTPGFESACGQGNYVETFMNAGGCDSIVTLHLTEMIVIANIASPPPQLSCAQNSVVLQGAGSTIGIGVTYQWTASNGGNIVGPSTGINATVNAPGDYQLLVCRTSGNATCCDSASTTVTGSQDVPNTPAAITGPDTICPGQVAGYSISPVANASSYNWTVPAGATIVSGQGTAGISVNWNAVNGGNICVAAVNACGSSPQTCLNVTAGSTLNPAQPQGATAACQGSTETYTVQPVAGVTSYNWTVDAPASIVSGQGTNSISVNWGTSTSGNVCVNVTNSCGAGQDMCLPVQINALPPQPLVSGDTALCSGTTGAYTILPVNNSTGYTWTVSANGALVSGQNTTAATVNWSGAPGGDVCVSATNGCGTGPQDCFPVAVYAQPVADGGPGGSVCDTAFSLQAVQSIGGSSGVWSSIGGPGTATFSNAASAATAVSVTVYGTYNFLWTENNAICQDTDMVTVNFNAPPATGPVSLVCDGNNQNYTVSFPVSGGTPPYTAAGGTINAGVFTSNPVPSLQTYSFFITDANGCISGTITGSFDCNCITEAGLMNLQTIGACPGDTIQAQHLGGQSLDADDVSAYVLHDNPGTVLGQVLAQNNTGTFNFQPGMTYGVTYYVSFVVGNNLNGAPDPADPCLSVAPGQPVIFYPFPLANAGTDNDTCGLTILLNGNIPNGAGMWSVAAAPAGATLNFSDPQNAAASATASLEGTYTLNWTITENGCTSSDQVTLQFNESPVLDDLQRTCDAANENFTVTLILSGGAQPYSINGAPVAGAVFASAPIPNGQTYNFTISDANGCTAAPVSGSFSCNCSTNAGAMQPDTLSTCEGTTLTVSPAAIPAVLDANDVTAWVLHSGSGPALGQVFAQNTTGQFGFVSGMNFGQTYFISLVAGNPLNGFPDPADPCFSVAAGQPVVFYKNPAPNAGPDAAVCGQTAGLQAVASGFSGSWSFVSGPGTATFSNGNSGNGQVTVSAFGAYVFKWTETNVICQGEDQVSISFNESPAFTALDEACNGTNTQYTVSFTASGGTAPYTVNGLGGSFTGNNFNSVPIASNTPYNFTIVDANGCASLPVNGTKDCNCVTDAGSMQTAPLLFCAGEQATGVWNSDASLDPDDILQFILHDQAGTNAGNILATGDQPVFDFTANLQTGVTYYISAVAGNNQAGLVDLNDPCLSVAPGAPVQWKALPDAGFTGDAGICKGDNTPLIFSGSGTFPLQVIYTDDTGGQYTLSITNQQPVTVNLMPDTSITYTLISVSDGIGPVCTTALSGSVTISVSTPVSAGVPNEPVEICAGIALPLQLINFLTDPNLNGKWTETSAVPALPGGFTAATGTFETGGQPAGTYTFLYTVDALAPCPDDAATVTVKLLAPPVADAGEDQAINCDQSAVALGSSGTSVGLGITYEWLANGVVFGNTAQVFASNAGNYTLIVTSPAGCSASDDVNVILDNDPPSAGSIVVQNVRCYGEHNGKIVIDSVETTHPPVLYALNGGAFGTNPVFSGLEPGNYTITLMDANGCEWTSPLLPVIEPPELIIDLGATIEAALGDSVYLSMESTAPVGALDTIIWKPLLDSIAVGKDYQRFFPLQSWNVNVTAIDSNGCIAADAVLVQVGKPRNVYIPNILSPQSALNGTLTVFGGRDVARVELFRIYDRWGALMFEALDFQPNDLSAGWNGKQGGKNVLPGVYVYYAVVKFIDGETGVYKGDVSVFR